MAGIIRRIECARLRLVENSSSFSDSKLSLCAAVSFRFYRRSSIEVAEENEIDSSHHADRPITNRAILTYAKGVTPFSVLHGVVLIQNLKGGIWESLALVKSEGRE